jgi:hypothetical protein
MNTANTNKRPYITRYFTDSDASGKLPNSVGYAATLRGAKRNMAVRIVLGQYGLAVVAERGDCDVLCFMRRTKAGLNIKDTEPSKQANKQTT